MEGCQWKVLAFLQSHCIHRIRAAPKVERQGTSNTLSFCLLTGGGVTTARSVSFGKTQEPLLGGPGTRNTNRGPYCLPAKADIHEPSRKQFARVATSDASHVGFAQIRQFPKIRSSSCPLGTTTCSASCRGLRCWSWMTSCCQATKLS